MSGIGKEEIATVFESIARLLELKGENPFKIRAYTNAAKTLGTYTGNLAKEAEAGTLGKIPGIGKAIEDKLTELLTTGKLEYYERLRAEFPAGLFALFELQGMGGKKIKALYDNLQVASVEALEKACRDGRVAALAGFGEKSAVNFLKAIALRKQHAGRFRLGDITAQANSLLEDLRRHPAVTRAAVAGSFRRSKETVHDLDFIVSTRKPAEVLKDFTQHALVEEVIACGDTKASVRIGGGLQCDLRAVSDAEYPFALCYFTGSKEHNIALRNRAIKRGWTLNEYRLAGEKPVPEIRDEAQLYRALGLAYVEPELREDRGEIAAAETETLPRLVEWTNLRGVFHNHTTASDGRNTLEEMAAAAQELGLQYLGIADHSKSSFQANGLDEKRLEQQRLEIEKRNMDYDGFRLFSGVECDILKDGSLDFSDEALAPLDYVVASVHSSFTLGEAEMTKRVIRAISNPHVTMLGHLTGRLLLSRESYALDIPAVIEAAAETGTIIELNANPWRLELDWRWWPLAKEKGVKCAINPDAHRVSDLQDVLLGVSVARKGWLTREDVVNCLPLGRIESVLQAKRSR